MKLKRSTIFVLIVKKVRTKEDKEAEAMRALREKQMAIETCRERADEMRLIDKYKFNQSISPEAREVISDESATLSFKI
jgi:hypothetical protein